MARIGNKLVVLDVLKAVVDDMAAKIGAKLAAPTVAGTAGQVLTANGDGTSTWKDMNIEVASIEEIKTYLGIADSPAE